MGGLRIWLPIRITLAHGVRGGMERQQDTLARGLAGRGHHVTVVTTAHPDGRRRDEDGGVETLYVPDTTWRTYQPRWWRASYALLRERHLQEPYDILLSQSAGGLGYLVQARQALGLPSAVILHGSSRREALTAWQGARSPRGVYRLLRLTWRLPPLWVRWRRAAPSVAHWLAVSPSIGRESRQEIGFPPDRLTVVPNGVDVARLRPDPAARARLRERHGLPPHAQVVVMASRLEMEKGVQVALDAVARLHPTHPHLYLLVAGAGVYAATLERRVGALGLNEHARFLGYVPHAELPALLAGADVFVMATLGPEGLPMSVLEAEAVGVPVVVSHVPGASAALLPGQSGVLFPAGDAAALAQRLAALLADPARRRVMGALGRALAERRFSVEAMVSSTESILEQAVRDA